MKELRALVEGLKEAAEVCDRIAFDIKDKVLKSHFLGVATGYRLAARKLETLVSPASLPQPENDEDLEEEKEVNNENNKRVVV